MNKNLTFSGLAAFTLTELLVAIATIAVLAALLVPAISRSKAKAQQIHCVSNLRQLGIGLQNFVTDNHAYPSFLGPTNSENPDWWISQLASGGFGNSEPATNLIVAGIWRCPSAPFKCLPPHEDVVFCSYGYNQFGSLGLEQPEKRANALGLQGTFIPGGNTFKPGLSGFAPLNESEVAVPSDMMAIGESIVGSPRFIRFDWGSHHRYAPTRHQGRINVAFCDGHVESLTPRFLFEDSGDAALVRWNRDHQPHRDKL